MAELTKADLRNLTTDELNTRVSDTRQELMNLRFQLATGELTDHTRLEHTRRLIARMLTILHEQQSAGATRPVARTEGES